MLQAMMRRHGQGGAQEAEQQRHQYSAVLHALTSIATAMGRIQLMERRLKARLALSAAVHFGSVVLGTAGADGQSWDAFGTTLRNASALAAAAATAVRPDQSVVALSREARKETGWARQPLKELFPIEVSPQWSQ